MKIAVIGTHGVGKTTLAMGTAAIAKKSGSNVKLISETARDCPFPLNKNFTKESALWIYHRQMQRELEATKNYPTVICDRSVIDSFMYAEAMGLNKSLDMCSSFLAAREWMKTYDKLIYVQIGSKEPSHDGVRDLDLEFQKKVEDCFDLFVLGMRNEMFIETMTSDDIFKQ